MRKSICSGLLAGMILLSSTAFADNNRIAFIPFPGIKVMWKGKWLEGTSYAKGDAVYFDGSSYYCNESHTATTTDYPPSPGWDLMTAAGSEGPQGLAGADGKPGDDGLQGPAGADGATGAQGAQGPTGPVGAVGATGAQGAQGPTGPVGADGAIGAQGPQGPTGPVGAVGATGAQGAQGPAGPVGADGAIGAQGPQGSTGPAGATGATGAQGPQGTFNTATILQYEYHYVQGTTTAFAQACPSGTLIGGGVECYAGYAVNQSKPWNNSWYARCDGTGQLNNIMLLCAQ